MQAGELALELSVAMRTDTGRRRAVNEDSALAAMPCFLVADGMGGHEAGDLASQAAVAAFASGIRPDERASVRAVNEALDAARVAVNRVAEGRERGAGCTLTGVVLVEHDHELYWLILNVGDSRVYLHRGSELRQLTVDHSLIEHAMAVGVEGEKLPPRNIITRALGSLDSVADTWLLPVETGARLLICSDGLTTELSDEQLRATLTMGGRAEAVAEELVRRANEAGGRDNITVVVVDVLAGGRAWHVGSDTSAPDTSQADETLTVTLPTRRV
ncbi:serine/threonine-protein phosphatase [Leucobacter coleopterorum]|uniref:Serine/threonine-protein phosphatase n=2 Tax=Leucobacter coleopterorum TaxID=2714933 RepID=A0ABX6JZT5_9MICO|nr:serine/threonine-protein phosphatase [Leucobacter coleopterorum]